MTDFFWNLAKIIVLAGVLGALAGLWGIFGLDFVTGYKIFISAAILALSIMWFSF